MLLCKYIINHTVLKSHGERKNGTLLKGKGKPTGALSAYTAVRNRRAGCGVDPCCEKKKKKSGPEGQRR